ncbi:MAG: sporulation protein YunB [Bacilli bacterium]|nr:sporulation protein YunB [Bacilli bacterium]
MEINKLTNDISVKIQRILNDIDASNISDYYTNNNSNIYKHIRNGIVCELSLGSIRNSLLFANIGPTIPIKLVFLSQNNVDIDFETAEYGINNIIVKMYLKVTLHEQITMPISSKRKEIVVKEPLTVHIIKGEIPYLFDKRIDR